MELLNTKVLRGPNYWSNSRHNLIVMKIDLQAYEELPTNLLAGFSENLKELLPSLYSHHCSEGHEGGFFMRIEEGTWLGHVIEHVALELQWLAGMNCGFGRTRSTGDKGIYQVVFAYEVERAGLYAGEAALALVNALAQGKPYTKLQEHLAELKKISGRDGFGPSTKSIVQEAQRRNIPYTRLDEDSLVMLGYGAKQKLICASTSSQTSAIGTDNASDKDTTKTILAAQFIPVPRGVIVETYEELEAAFAIIQYPWVIKPVDGNHGRGITTNINDKEKAFTAFALAQQVSKKVIIEQFILGFDFRFLVINYKLVAVAQRTPALVIGNGAATVEELIHSINLDPMRSPGHENFLTAIIIDEATLKLLEEQNYTLNTVVPAGQIVYLKYTANISTGGTSTDVTDYVHPYNKFLAERIARLIGLDVCGIDVVATDVSMPLGKSNGAVIEVNAGPGFRMHLSPAKGKARHVAEPFVGMLFPEGDNGRIPLVAVTGTNGKTTTVRLVAHMAKHAGHTVGLTTTEGIYIDGHQIYAGDCSGPFSAKVVLRDPLVDFAVLECARGGILRSGLGFDQSTISVITNVSEDHFGIDDIHCIEDMARAKETVVLSTDQNGYSILNADDDLVYDMKNRVKSQVALFSMHANNPRILEHCEHHGLAAYVENGFIMVRHGQLIQTIAHVAEIPLSFGGQAEFMIQNILSSVLVGIISSFSVEQIAQSLAGFYPSPENLPGRMNLYQFHDFKVMLDYGHNEGAFIQLQKFLNQMPASKKTGVIAATGDRKPEDIRKVGYYAAQLFDEIIIRHDMDGRGATNDYLTDLLLEGISQVKDLAEANVKIISQEREAIEYAMHHAIPGEFIFYFPENVAEATHYLASIQATKMKLVSSV